MADFADARCDKLSTGMKQKVSIARTASTVRRLCVAMMIFDNASVSVGSSPRPTSMRTLRSFLATTSSRPSTSMISSAPSVAS